ncbi:hypothetical protein CR205_17210 [Alteribacter lacisalsi]|uniref:NADPH--hemoprotein reductase n=1 Tax=Alteribacter lacisalsi TaxID=2045244 RepID=A0A2W0H4L5_9BACI|nr:hypothetical protein [Alteribacter lacisalsi]PYZ96107.1 hypothetical protein CR205_17210 [Alteribacter lacisalsi]
MKNLVSFFVVLFRLPFILETDNPPSSQSFNLKSSLLINHLNTRLKPRYYSISSSPEAQKDQVSITVSVVRGEAFSGRGEYQGVTSNFLMELKPGDDIVVFFRTQRSFKLPEDSAVPIVMVGPGTGIAPFRGFLQARQAKQKEGEHLGDAHLYFGSRHEQYDYLYNDEIEAYEEEGVVTMHTAFSRMENKPKTYVQDVMKEQEEELIEMIEDKGAHIYICGEGGSMAPQVEETLKKCFINRRQSTEKEAQEWLDGLQEEGRFVKDVW